MRVLTLRLNNNLRGSGTTMMASLMTRMKMKKRMKKTKMTKMPSYSRTLKLPLSQN
jgi:hypothetical protein